MQRNTHTDRLASAVSRQRVNLGISRRELAVASGVSTTTIERLESGIKVRPAKVVSIAATLLAFEFYAAPKALENERAVLRVAS